MTKTVQVPVAWLKRLMELSEIEPAAAFLKGYIESAEAFMEASNKSLEEKK